MLALTVQPGTPNSIDLTTVPEPPKSDGDVLVKALALGVCGTDREIIRGEYGAAPPGAERLILGHESLGRVEDAPVGSGFAKGELVAGIVRRPDPVPCPHCAIGEWDLCSNGRYTERGIKQRDGYAAEIVRLEPAFAVRVDAALGTAGVLTEPASVVAKAWAEIDCFASRSAADVKRSVLVTGAGPMGLLAALMGVQRQHDITVYDHAESGPKPDPVRDLGAGYRSPSAHPLRDGDRFDVILDAGVDALARADRAWLERLISRRVPLDDWPRAFERQPGDVKAVLDFAG